MSGDLKNIRAIASKKLRTAWRLMRSTDFVGLCDRLARLPFKISRIAKRLRFKLVLKDPPGVDPHKVAFIQRAKRECADFLFSRTRLTLDTSEKPEVTIILLLYNKVEFTYLCLKSLSILKSSLVKFATIIIDNASSDDTKKLLDQVDGCQIIYNQDNVGFLRGCNQAAELVRSEYILFLNNDTEVFPGSVEAALTRLQNDKTIGAVGGRIILPNGTLQEAGNIIWRDGNAVGYARGEAPDFGPAMFVREVDYCSGAFLMTRAELFARQGGFDARYLPAYYEETDFCMNLRKMGLKIMYEPRVAIRHFEFGSSILNDRAFTLMNKNRSKFREKHAAFLDLKHAPKDSPHLQFRTPDQRPRLLFIEDRVPHVYYGAGFPRANSIFNALHAMGFACTLFVTREIFESWGYVYEDIPDDVEVILRRGEDELATFLKERSGHYQIVWCARPHNLQRILQDDPKVLSTRTFSLIYDAEALFSVRDQHHLQVFGRQKALKYWTTAEEMALGSYADVITSVTQSEAELWQRMCQKPTHIVGHEYRCTPTPAGFYERQDFLFLGALHAPDSPNGDSLVWFLEKVYPMLKGRIPEGIRVKQIGYISEETLEWFARNIKDLPLDLLGKVSDLTPYFNSCRAMIVPTRFASGIPQKIFDAAAFGLPVVCTDIIAKQMEWTDGEEILSAPVNDVEGFANRCVKLYESEELWKNVRKKSLDFMKKRSDPSYFSKHVEAAVLSAYKARGWEKNF